MSVALVVLIQSFGVFEKEIVRNAAARHKCRCPLYTMPVMPKLSPGMSHAEKVKKCMAANPGMKLGTASKMVAKK